MAFQHVFKTGLLSMESCAHQTLFLRVLREGLENI